MRDTVMKAFALLVLVGCGGIDDEPDLVQSAAALTSGEPALATPAWCTEANGIHHAELPIYWNRPGSPKFTYYYQIQLATEGDWRTAPIGVVIPGGAGAPSIGLGAGAIFPATFNVLYTDVRGVGCNIGTPFADDALTTEYFARDVLMIVSALQLRSYVLYGISYGTVQATVMAHLARTEGWRAPSALVLEGVLGLWSINARNTLDLNREWTHVKTLLPPAVAESFAQTPLPLGLSNAEWMALLTTSLDAGTTPALGNNTVYYAMQASLGDPQGIVRTKLDQINASWRPEIVHLATTLFCTETAGTIHAKQLVNGAIVEGGPEQCSLPLVAPYDAAAHPVGVPIYYFEGANDPNTTPENAAYHYLHQTQTTRVFTLIGGGGHPALSKTLHERGCTPAIFTAIANGTGFGDALRSCTWPVTVTVGPAG
jgi:pimeloyl-ACP methyl ester carboxylesterase